MAAATVFSAISLLFASTAIPPANNHACLQSVGLDALFRAKTALNCVGGCPDGSYKLHMNVPLDRMVLGVLCDAADDAHTNGQVTCRKVPLNKCKIAGLTFEQSREMWKKRQEFMMPPPNNSGAGTAALSRVMVVGHEMQGGYRLRSQGMRAKTGMDWCVSGNGRAAAADDDDDGLLQEHDSQRRSHVLSTRSDRLT